MTPAIPYIVAMGAFAIILAFVVIILTSKAPKCMIYSMIVLNFVLLLGGIVSSIIFQVYQAALILGIVMAVWACVLFCLRKQLQVGITLLKVTGSFIQEKPGVLLAPVIVLLISIFYLTFWLASLIAIQLNRPINEYFTSNPSMGYNKAFLPYDIFTVIWIFVSIFYTYFLYYVMVFLISTAAGLWYYGI